MINIGQNHWIRHRRFKALGISIKELELLLNVSLPPWIHFGSLKIVKVWRVSESKLSVLATDGAVYSCPLDQLGDG